MPIEPMTCRTTSSSALTLLLHPLIWPCASPSERHRSGRELPCQNTCILLLPQDSPSRPCERNAKSSDHLSVFYAVHPEPPSSFPHFPRKKTPQSKVLSIRGIKERAHISQTASATPTSQVSYGGRTNNFLKSLPLGNNMQMKLALHKAANRISIKASK